MLPGQEVWVGKSPKEYKEQEVFGILPTPLLTLHPRLVWNYVAQAALRFAEVLVSSKRWDCRCVPAYWPGSLSTIHKAEEPLRWKYTDTQC